MIPVIASLENDRLNTLNNGIGRSTMKPEGLYRLNQDVVFRIEDFGGLLIGKKTSAELVLDLGETQFLLLLERFGGNIQKALAVSQARAKKKIDYKRMIRTRAIVPVESTEATEECGSLLKNCLNGPLELTIYPTLKCNLNCKFCFIKNKHKPIEEMPASRWIEIVEEAEKMKVFSISVLGGEPTLYSGINELLTGISRLHINTTITTNGTHISDDLLDIITAADNIVPVFSIQALNEKNRYLMGCDYNTTLQSLQRFIAKGKRVRINSVYTNQIYDEFYQIIDYCISNGVERYSIGVYTDVNPSNNGINNHTFEEARKLDETLNKYIDAKYGKKHPFRVSLEGCLLYTAYPELEAASKNLSEYEKIYYGCRAGRTKMEVYPNGDVYPCICYENVLEHPSSLKTGTLQNIWDTDPKMLELRKARCNIASCEKCGYGAICNGGCGAIREQEYHEQYLEHKDRRCVLHEGN